MKKIFVILFLIGLVTLIGCCPNSCNAQSNVVTVDISKLPLDVQNLINEQNESNVITQKLETYGKWAGMGKEIGVAAREGLTAVKDVTLEVADTNVGKTVLWLIIWNVAGRDAVGIIIGLLFGIIGTFLITKSYFRSFSNKRLETKTGFFLWPKKEYVYFSPIEYWGDESNRSAAQTVHALIWLGLIGISCAIMFG